MARPFRRYAFVLAERLGMPVNDVLATHTSADIAEWMAIDSLNDPDYREKIQHEIDLEKSRQLTNDERTAAFKLLLGGK